MPAIGPEMRQKRRRRRSGSGSVCSRSSYDSSSSRSSCSASPSGSDASTRRRPAVAGPQLPAGFLRSRSRSDSASSSHSKASSSDEEGPSVGPALPTASTSNNDDLNAGARAFLEREARKNAAAEEAKVAAEKAANSRPEWMLLPPSLSNTSSLQAVAGDPLNLKSRGFAQSTPRVSARGGGGGGGGAEDADMSLWTETPEERMKRMQDQVSGVRPKDGSGLSEKEALEREMTARRDESIAASVAEGRGKKSLVEEHNERRKKEMQEKLEDEAREKRRREKHRTREEQEDDKDRRSSRRSHHDDSRRRRHRSRSPDGKDSERHSSSSSHRHRSSRHSDPHRSHSSRHRSHRHSGASDDDEERRRERSKRKESDRHRDKDKDKDKGKDKERKKSRKEREEQDVREGKAAAPLIWDREAALSIGARLMDVNKRAKMLADANALGDRFGSGNRRFL